MSSHVVVPSHLLGDRRDPTWGDMSEYVVHFTRDPAVFAEILATGCLRARKPFGFGHFRNLPEVRRGHQSVCFSEVPLDKIQRLTVHHGNYGIAFPKDFIRDNEGARVWYVDQGSRQAADLRHQLHELVGAGDFDNSLWGLTPFIDLVMPGRYEWDWEREWRVRGDLHFRHSDVAFVVTPEGVDELPGLEGFYVHPKHDLIVAASPQPLADYLEQLIEQFLQTFENPAESLPVDEGEYVWIVQEWETEYAVDDLFPGLEAGVLESLVDYLNGVSWSWVRSDELASIWE